MAGNKEKEERRRQLEILYSADPALAERFEAGLSKTGFDLERDILKTMADDIVRGLSLDHTLGRMLADGYLAIAASGAGAEAIEYYGVCTRDAMKEGPGLGRIIAGTLGPVLVHGGKAFAERFLHTISFMRTKWLYAMASGPVEVVAELISDGDTSAGAEYLGLLCDLFSHDLTYNQYRRFSAEIPRAVLSIRRDRRTWTLEQLRRVAACDFDLACGFSALLAGELSLLSKEGLKEFVDTGLGMFAKDREAGERFLLLESRAGAEACDRMRTAAVFPEIQQGVARYIQARTARQIGVRPVSSVPGNLLGGEMNGVAACSDGRNVYLAAEVDLHPSRHENNMVYKALAWIEAGLIEFGTFDFDFDRACELCGGLLPSHEGSEARTDMERFFSLFPDPETAGILFSIVEYGRIRTLLERMYAGGAYRFYSHLAKGVDPQGPLIYLLHAAVALGVSPSALAAGDDRDILDKAIMLFERHAAGKPMPEASALAVSVVWKEMGARFCGNDAKKGGKLPYALRIRPSLYLAAFGEYERRALMIKEKLERAGYKAYKSDILKKIVQRGGKIDAEEISDIVRVGESGLVSEGPLLDLSDVFTDSAEFLADRLDTGAPLPGRTYRYREWDNEIGDYLDDHVLVRERVAERGDNRFYKEVLEKHRGLVKRIRYAFELLRPQGLSLLRRWREGDDFDYRRLIDFVVDKRCGLTPSERIYIKRLKQVRDVAVMLLVDLSRSTSNRVEGLDGTTVLDVEKEAAVLFCEALEVVGDIYAIAGFSGSGRLGVDYFVIKEFDRAMDEDAKACIGALSPQRNTRMGAAVRHSAAKLKAVPAISKLLIIITDGFPNDAGYKRERAMEDTRRALLEARAERIAAHAITVNIRGGADLDGLYGRVRHTLISDVRELPDRLLKIYGRLTG